jgi:Polysaccharide pyruvyl transferase
LITAIFDTTIGSYNLGNNIIMDSVYLELSELFPCSQYFKLPTMDIGRYTRYCISQSDLVFFGGTNSLNADMRQYRQWDLSLRNIFGVQNVILMGLGWWQYENKPISSYTKFLLTRALSKKYKHSVRDAYTKKKLESIGIKSVNTGCPTLWRITDAIIKKIPEKKQKLVVFTLTDYNHDINRDTLIIKMCLNNYDKVLCFPQGIGDINYVESLGFKNEINFLRPRVEEYREILEKGETDYIGTRLHAGIMAMQKSCHAIIVGIDNRAVEMGRDFGLSVVNAAEPGALRKAIEERVPVNIKVPFSEIEEWKRQFSKFYDI